MPHKDPERRSGFDRRKQKRRSLKDQQRNSDNNWLITERRASNERRKNLREENIVLPAFFKVRTVYFKVNDMEKAVKFYSDLFGAKPKKSGNVWNEWSLGNINFGLRLNDFNDKWEGANFVPVFEFLDDEVYERITKAKELGAVVIEDALEDPSMQSVVLKDPFGNDFEISKMHD